MHNFNTIVKEKSNPSHPVCNKQFGMMPPLNIGTNVLPDTKLMLVLFQNCLNLKCILKT